MRTDPTDNGGLFIGRRPGTAPVKYRALPQRGSASRRRIDKLVAFAVLALMFVISALYWGPIPAGALWVASQVQFHTDNLGFGLLTGFAVLLGVLFGGLMVLKRLDQLWILLRRAAGVDQREGVIGRVFGLTAVIGATLFMGWLLLIAGPGASLAPTG